MGRDRSSTTDSYRPVAAIADGSKNGPERTALSEQTILEA